MKKKDIEGLARELDSQDMVGYTRNFMDDFESAISKEIDIDVDKDWSGVLCLGMGGSGAGGMFLSTLADYSGGIPFVVWRDYGLPSWWGPDWLVLATSYSGNTEETLEAFEIAKAKSAEIACVTSGGKLLEWAKENNFNHIQLPTAESPRTMMGYSITQLLYFLNHYGLISDTIKAELNKAATLIDDLQEEIRADAERISDHLEGKIPVIYACDGYGGMAVRFRQQLNENAKMLCWHHIVPEMNHNEIVAWCSEGHSRAMIALTCEGIHPRSQARLQWVMDNVENQVSWRIECEGESVLERLLYAAHVTDWVSIMLAVLKGQDPSDMAPIDSLKAFLSTVQ